MSAASCNSQLRVTPAKATMTYTLADYRLAASTLWGEAGEWTVDEFQRHNERYFAGELPPLPIVFGLAAYGHCVALTRYRGEWHAVIPRITIATSAAPPGRNEVSDRLLHEMIHAKLILASESPDHNSEPWCREIMRITPLLGLPEIHAAPDRVMRVGKGKASVVRRVARPGCLARLDVAGWPHTLRPPDYPKGPRLQVSTY